MTSTELRWQKIQAQEKDTQAILQRDFSASRMNTTKWKEVAECLTDLSVSRRIRFADVAEVLEIGSFWNVTRDWFDCSSFGPFTSVSIEWLEINKKRGSLPHLWGRDG